MQKTSQEEEKEKNEVAIQGRVVAVAGDENIIFDFGGKSFLNNA